MAKQEISSRPVRVDSVSRWDAETDVLIVGYGGAGACAAIEAASLGAETLVLEAASGGGGTTAVSAGHIYLGGGTRVQKACGYEDTPENLLRYLNASSDQPDVEKFELYANESVAHFDWLVSIGVPFNDSIHEGRTSMQQSDECLLWSGNEKAWPYCEQAAPAPRGHKVAAEGEGGPLLFAKLDEAAQRAGATIRYDTQAVALVVDDGGRVVGVAAREGTETRMFGARGGVILCAGGFAMNDEMFARHVPRLAGRVQTIGTPGDDGSAIRLGTSVGGCAVHMSDYHITLPFYPPGDLTYGILVNGQGQRFIAEDAYHGRIGEVASLQPDGVVYLIVDEAAFGRPEVPGFEIAAVEENIADLERSLGLPSPVLQQTWERYNEGAARGEDPLFRKQAAWLRPLDQGPLAAIDCRLGHAPYMAFTLGGLRTLTTGEVLTESGEIVPGLYAAGRAACGIPRSATGYASGTCVGDATFFGRLAGRRASGLG